MREWFFGLEQFSPQVRQQALTMVTMFLCGMVIGGFRTVDILTMKRISMGTVAAWIQEVLFWLLSGFCASEFLYYCTFGELSIHGIAAMVLGFFLWKRIFHREIVAFVGQVIGRQNSSRWGIIKGTMNTGETIGEKIYGKNETKPFVQKRARKQRHRHR